jgi:hypothetical protein
LHGCWDIPKSVPSITLLGDGHRGAPRLREAVTALAKAGTTPSWPQKQNVGVSKQDHLYFCALGHKRASTAATILFATNGNRKKTTMLQSETPQLIRLLATDYRRETGFSIRDCIELASDHDTPYRGHLAGNRNRCPWSRANGVPDSFHKKRPMVFYELRIYTLRVGTMVEGGEMSVWSTKTRTAALSVRTRWRPGITQGKRTPLR